MNEQSIIKLNNVSFGYNPSRKILENLNMQIKRGDVVAIMGGSGSGKTTLLRLISGLIQASEGTIEINQTDIKTLSQSQLYDLRRQMGMLFQFGALFTDMSVFDNVAFPLREHTQLPETMIRDLVLMKLNAVGLRGASHLMPTDLSGGMVKRVALARAIALDPCIIFYDEPFAGLDPISIGVTGNLIRQLNDALGATSIMVTHDVHESLEIVDHVYFVANGHIIANGTPEEVKNSQSDFVKQFIHGEIDGPVPFHYPADKITHVL